MDEKQLCVIDPFSGLIVPFTPGDVQALLDAESSMGEPPVIGGVDYESGSKIVWSEPSSRLVSDSTESEIF